MKPTRVAAILLLAFLFGGSSAEVAVHAKRAIERRRAPEEGSAGALVALEIHGERGEVLARPRVLASRGRAAQLFLRDPLRPDVVRLALRVEASREASGDLAVDYELTLPAASLTAAGRVQTPPGVEQLLDVGEAPVTATLLAVPVPSAEFDAFLESERARPASGLKPI